MQRYLITILLCAFSLSLFAQRKVKGDGNVVKETRRVSDFDQIVVKGAFKVVLRQSDRHIVEVSTDENLQDFVTTRVESGVLTLAQEKEIEDATEQVVYVEVVELDQLIAEGASEILSENSLSSRNLEVKVSGASKVVLILNTERFGARIDGAGLVQLSGRTEEATLDISGAGNIGAYELKAQTVAVELSGAGAAQVHAEELLDVRISGLGAVNYEGNPEVRKSIGGLGTVSRRND